MKLTQFVFIGMFLHLAVTIPVQDENQNRVPIAYDDHQDPQLWQKSGKIEGDMLLTPEQQAKLYKDVDNRNGVIDTSLRWPNRIVPYEFSGIFNVSEREYITAVLNEDYARTCIRVVPRTNEADYVYITGANTGCWSWVGRLGGRQELNLQRSQFGCMNYRTIVHEFLHAAGFYHQQSATERDDYVNIQWENIAKGHEHNFEKYGTDTVSSFGERYDYGSVMHYDAYAFSKNGKKTIVPKKIAIIGKARKLSKIDIAKLNKMYGC